MIFGPLFLIKIVLFIWIAVILLLILGSSYSTFLITGMVGGVSLGAIWTLNRHVVANIAPEAKIGELFGLEGLTEKIRPFGVGYFWLPGNRL